MDLRPSSEMRLAKIVRGPSMSRPGTSLAILESFQGGDSSPATSPGKAAGIARPSTSMGLMPLRVGGMPRPGTSGGGMGHGASSSSAGLRRSQQQSMDGLSSTALRSRPATSMGESRNVGSRWVGRSTSKLLSNWFHGPLDQTSMGARRFSIPRRADNFT